MAITDSCSLNERLCTQQCPDDAAKAKCELHQSKKNMYPGFAIAFDDTDGKHERGQPKLGFSLGQPKDFNEQSFWRSS